jgi:pre-mRNA branch site protein p14
MVDESLKTDTLRLVLYHQPEKMVRSKEDIQERQENLERLKQQHGIE